jgi:hypothetical protein
MNKVYNYFREIKQINSIFFNFGNKSKSGGLSQPDFDLFRRKHYVGNASESLRRCLMR